MSDSGIDHIITHVNCNYNITFQMETEVVSGTLELAVDSMCEIRYQGKDVMVSLRGLQRIEVLSGT